MQRISSNSTIFFKIFLPTIWATFFFAFAIGLLWSDTAELPGMLSISWFRWVFLGSVVFFISLIYLTLVQLKRVELSDEGMYVSNYFKTYRYSYHDLKEIKILNFGLFTIAKFKMSQKTKMGKSIPVLLKRKYFEEFVLSHSHIFKGKIKD